MVEMWDKRMKSECVAMVDHARCTMLCFAMIAELNQNQYGETAFKDSILLFEYRDSEVTFLDEKSVKKL